MTNKLFSSLWLALGFLIIFPTLASAHQPRLVEDGLVIIKNPEVSQAFYGELQGAPANFQISSKQDFRLYVGLLVPDIAGVKKDLSVEITKVTDQGSERIALLSGDKFDWTPFYEEFARDNYLWGPEYQAAESKRGVALKGQQASAGTYNIKVSSPSNQGKYSLVVGDLEAFPIIEALHAALIIPGIKAQFFHDSFLSILATPFGWGYILGLYLLAFVVGLLYRFALMKLSTKSDYQRLKNIGLADRLVRVDIGLGLFLLAVATNWSPWFIFFSGLCLFEAVFSWCGLYAALGKNTCPLK